MIFSILLTYLAWAGYHLLEKASSTTRQTSTERNDSADSSKNKLSNLSGKKRISRGHKNQGYERPGAQEESRITGGLNSHQITHVSPVSQCRDVIREADDTRLNTRSSNANSESELPDDQESSVELEQAQSDQQTEDLISRRKIALSSITNQDQDDHVKVSTHEEARHYSEHDRTPQIDALVSEEEDLQCLESANIHDSISDILNGDGIGVGPKRIDLGSLDNKGKQDTQSESSFFHDIESNPNVPQDSECWETDSELKMPSETTGRNSPPLEEQPCHNEFLTDSEQAAINMTLSCDLSLDNGSPAVPSDNINEQGSPRRESESATSERHSSSVSPDRNSNNTETLPASQRSRFRRDVHRCQFCGVFSATSRSGNAGRYSCRSCASHRLRLHLSVYGNRINQGNVARSRMLAFRNWNRGNSNAIPRSGISNVFRFANGSCLSRCQNSGVDIPRYRSYDGVSSLCMTCDRNSIVRPLGRPLPLSSRRNTGLQNFARSNSPYNDNTVPLVTGAYSSRHRNGNGRANLPNAWYAMSIRRITSRLQHKIAETLQNRIPVFRLSQPQTGLGVCQNCSTVASVRCYIIGRIAVYVCAECEQFLGLLQLSRAYGDGSKLQ